MRRALEGILPIAALGALRSAQERKSWNKIRSRRNYMQRESCCLAVMALVLTVPCLASDYGRGDVFGTVGMFTAFGGGHSSSHVMVGGGASGLFAGDKAALFGEFNYIPLGNAMAYSPATGAFVTLPFSVKQYMIGGGVRLYVLTADHSASRHPYWVRMYVPIAGGLLRTVVGGVSSGGSNAGYFGTGLGAEIGRRHFGVRPEFRYVRMQTSSGGGNNITIAAGVFYRFGS
jgi:hypothetical protein